MDKINTWIIGDIHGEHEKLIKLLKLIKFDYENDTLIQLGDVVDRGPDSFSCVEELLKIKNLIAIRGNHDACWRDSFMNEEQNVLWNQGGRETWESYKPHCQDDLIINMPMSHREFFVKTQVNYYINEDNDCFVHGGFDRHQLIKDQHESNFLWDRDLFMAALSFKAMKGNYKFKNKDKFKRIFIGHTPTVYWNATEEISKGGIIKRGEPITIPMKAANIWNLDTGCGKGGFPLSAMNLETEEYFQVN